MSATTTTAGRALDHHDHRVEFYETDESHARSVASFLAASLREHDAALAIATPAHLERFDEALADAGVDIDEAVYDGRYLAVDATRLLAALTAGGALDESRFRTIVGSLIAQAAGDRREVRIYGELVALLLERGDAAATIALEENWNELAQKHDFELLCGYPARAFDDDASGPFTRICEQHTAVMPAERYTLPSDVQEHRRLVGRLRDDAASLREELERLRREQESLIELAYNDPITGLANRRAFDDHLDREWALASRGEHDSFVLIADLDGFKHLNDTHGHAAGDDVLRAFGEMLRLSARGTDIVARIGGDEFGVLLVRCDERAVHTFRDRLREIMATRLDPHIGPLGVSLGHASLRHSSSPATALDRADLAMLAIKRSRRRRRSERARGA